ncbi:unnamed protein product [Callosobruchus maculatus]|uniref:TRUD domain-containing protein n=1 Tax=Callosobruchus maculatus TaxID=64391 RepID=A0A653C539_CALMS|nr:unnamed protein product [Callosobruchus maculatus]
MNHRRGRRKNFSNHRNHQARLPKVEFKNQIQLSEKEVGITEYLSPLEGFSAVIKARYSDFQVREIQLDGKVAKLTDTSYPKDFCVKTIGIDPKDVDQSPCEHISQEQWVKLKELLDTSEAEPIKINADGITKEARKEIHECMKKYFGKKLVVSTITVEEDGTSKKYIEIKKHRKGDKQDNRQEWPEGIGEYVHFLVYKENVDTLDACFKISEALKMRPSKLTYAGVKDKRAITTQCFCIHKVNPCKILNRTKHIRPIKIGNFSYKSMQLKLGDLQGNNFRIALRNVAASDDVIEEALNLVKNRGFINYYGLQRFGNDKEVPTYEIGIKFLLGQWQAAVELILKPRTSDDPSAFNGDIAKAKKVYAETKDAKKAFNQFSVSKHKCVESKLLQGIMETNENDYVNALEKVPRSMRLFYMHSFQSLIWNKMASKRIQLFGLHPVEGDLVLCGDSKDTCKEADDINLNDGEDEPKKEDSGTENTTKPEIKVLAKEDLENYTVYDIVLPTPGYDVVYPENLKEHYKAVLEEFGLTLEMPKQKVKTYTLSGNYRKILQKPDFTWKIMFYNSPTDNLIRSDFEELRGIPEPKSAENGKYKALLIDVNLPTSSYATMLLREILKTDTASSAHAKLNDYHDNKNEKIAVENGGDGEEPMDESPCFPGSSLLADPEKFKEFQNSIFSVVSGEKRKHKEDSECYKKAKVPHQSTETENT